MKSEELKETTFLLEEVQTHFKMAKDLELLKDYSSRYQLQTHPN